MDITSPAADVNTIVGKISHLIEVDKGSLQSFLHEYEELFDDNIGTLDTAPVLLELKPEVTPYHDKP